VTIRFGSERIDGSYKENGVWFEIE
jgi:hypothetical protein